MKIAEKLNVSKPPWLWGEQTEGSQGKKKKKRKKPLSIFRNPELKFDDLTEVRYAS